jgi:adenine C2-methylase RlmN of 23S rRNA A2503 and tRNA A37
MYRLSDELPFVNLAFSLHAPNQEVRLKIVPAAKAHPLGKLMAAIDYHIEKNNTYHDQNAFEVNKTFSQKKTNNAKAAAASPLPAGGEEPQENTTGEEDGDADEEEEIEEGVKTVMLKSKRKPRGKITGVMIEYILIKDINDQDQHAHELAQLLLPRKDYVLLNLIPYNPTEVAEDYQPPDWSQVESFHRICMSKPYDIHTRVRHEKGQDIAGACGQLAVVKEKEREKNAKQQQQKGNNQVIDEKQRERTVSTELEDLGKPINGSKCFFLFFS